MVKMVNFVLCVYFPTIKTNNNKKKRGALEEVRSPWASFCTFSLSNWPVPVFVWLMHFAAGLLLFTQPSWMDELLSVSYEESGWTFESLIPRDDFSANVFHSFSPGVISWPPGPRFQLLAVKASVCGLAPPSSFQLRALETHILACNLPPLSCICPFSGTSSSIFFFFYFQNVCLVLKFKIQLLFLNGWNGLCYNCCSIYEYILHAQKLPGMPWDLILMFTLIQLAHIRQ